jgi:hypothetical protein
MNARPETAFDEAEPFSTEDIWPDPDMSLLRPERLPVDERSNAGILAGENDEAAALNLYGSNYGLPKAISGSDTFFLRGYGSPPPETLIVVGFTRQDVDSLFEKCSVAGTITNPYDVENDLRNPPDIFVCHNPRLPWEQLWKQLKRYS